MWTCIFPCNFTALKCNFFILKIQTMLWPRVTPSFYIIWERSTLDHSQVPHNNLHSIYDSSKICTYVKPPKNKPIPPRRLYWDAVRGKGALVPYSAMDTCPCFRRMHDTLKAKLLAQTARYLSKAILCINYLQVSLRTIFSEHTKLKLAIKQDIRSC